ncbi:MAG: hypothetical protein P8M80_14000 [Pirellulaceae bacterium]|jgi:hypothetical protein|nr:hypothetical protein [Pirellulaceae bacterium]MDG2470389.1 hypothetical protein [Pirellulaceae bacterium]
MTVNAALITLAMKAMMALFSGNTGVHQDNSNIVFIFAEYESHPGLPFSGSPTGGA